MSEPLKIFCSKCNRHLDVTDLAPFDRFHCPICNEALTVPKVFERYHLLELCGRGGMSKVYRARDLETEQIVAIKITDASIFDANTEGERFQFEAELVSKIKHPGIIPVYRGGIFENQPFLVMEYMKKGNLEQLQRQDMLPPGDKILNWMSVIAGGLQAAGKFGIIHHDVKPANIMLSEDGAVKIGDFDLAEIRVEGQGPASADWASLAYVSPERLFHGHEDQSGDIFSLGVSTYELLTGVYPFGCEGEVEELLERREKEDYQPVNVLNSTVSQSVSDFIDRMLRFLPGCRPDYAEIIEFFGFAGVPTDTLSMRRKMSDKLKFWLGK